MPIASVLVDMQSKRRLVSRDAKAMCHARAMVPLPSAVEEKSPPPIGLCRRAIIQSSVTMSLENLAAFNMEDHRRYYYHSYDPVNVGYDEPKPSSSKKGKRSND